MSQPPPTWHGRPARDSAVPGGTGFQPVGSSSGSSPPVANPAAGGTPLPSFWQRRIRAPLLALLTQGATPEKLAAGMGWGVVCSLFPFLGTTTALNTAVAAWRRLNQPLVQAINIALGPVHLVMILVYVRLGETLLGATGEGRFSVTEMLRAFAELSLADFLARFGLAGVHAFVAWALTAPLLYWITYYSARPALRRLARLLPAGASAPAARP